MPRLLVLAALLGATALVQAQDFPAPGTGLLSFEPVGDGRRLQHESFAFSQDGVLFTSSDSLYRFEPAPGGPPGGSWRAVSRRRQYLSAVATVGATADTLLIGWQGDIFRSLDGGTTWATVHPDGPNRPDGFFALPPGHPHAGRLLAGGAILYSDDRGASWSEATRAFPGEQGRAAAFAALPSGRVLMAGNWGVAASDDGGASYAVTPLWGDYAVDTYSITSLATPGSRQSGAPACEQSNTALCDGAVVTGISVTAADMQVWRTNDGGRTWAEPVSLPEPYDGVGGGYPASVVGLPPGPDGLGRALVVGRRGVLYRTLDGGETWEAIGRMPLLLSEGVHYAQLARLGPDGHLWVATIHNGPVGDYLYRSRERVEAAFVVSSEGGPETGPARLTVRPNPSAGRVHVQVSVSTSAATADAAVYDVLGRRVAVLHEGPLGAGPHALSFDTSALAPGVYVVRVAVTPAGGAPWSEARRVTITR